MSDYDSYAHHQNLLVSKAPCLAEDVDWAFKDFLPPSSWVFVVCLAIVVSCEIVLLVKNLLSNVPGHNYAESSSPGSDCTL